MVVSPCGFNVKNWPVTTSQSGWLAKMSMSSPALQHYKKLFCHFDSPFCADSGD